MKNRLHRERQTKSVKVPAQMNVPVKYNNADAILGNPAQTRKSMLCTRPSMLCRKAALEESTKKERRVPVYEPRKRERRSAAMANSTRFNTKHDHLKHATFSPLKHSHQTDPSQDNAPHPPSPRDPLAADEFPIHIACPRHSPTSTSPADP